MSRSDREVAAIFFLIVLLLVGVVFLGQFDLLPPARPRVQYQQMRPRDLEPPYRPPNREEIEGEREQLPFLKFLQPVPIHRHRLFVFVPVLIFKASYDIRKPQVWFFSTNLVGPKGPGYGRCES